MCKIEKPITDFAPSQPSWCRLCLRYYRREWRKNNYQQELKTVAKLREKNKNEFIQRGVTITEKICTKCGIKKLSHEFGYDRNRKTGLNYICKKCANSIHKFSNCLKYDKRFELNTCSRKEYYEIIAIGECIYCHMKGDIGADRIDNNKGHEKDNIVPCCVVCNRARSNYFTVEEMKEIIGPAVAEVRYRRILQTTNNNLISTNV